MAYRWFACASVCAPCPPRQCFYFVKQSKPFPCSRAPYACITDKTVQGVPDKTKQQKHRRGCYVKNIEKNDCTGAYGPPPYHTYVYTHRRILFYFQYVNHLTTQPYKLCESFVYTISQYPIDILLPTEYLLLYTQIYNLSRKKCTEYKKSIDNMALNMYNIYSSAICMFTLCRPLV